MSARFRNAANSQCREMEMPNVTEIDSFSANDVVEEDSVDALITNKEIGARLKRLRLRRSMGLVELGERAGLSASYLSQLETGRVVPTLRNLSRIAMVHKVDISYFFTDVKRALFKLSRSRDRINIPVGPKDRPFMLSQSMAGLIADRSLVPCIAMLRPGLDSEVFVGKQFQGIEFAYVLEGAVSVKAMERAEVLEQGDVAWIGGSQQRQYKCVGEAPARVMIVSFQGKA